MTSIPSMRVWNLSGVGEMPEQAASNDLMNALGDLLTDDP